MRRFPRVPVWAPRARWLALPLVLFLPLPACAPRGAADPAADQQSAASLPPAGQVPAPDLIVLVTVDQLRPDYLERYGPQLTGGLARLTRQGAHFVRAWHDHAITETAPGHAATLSGRFPSGTGIRRNSEGVQDSAATLIGGGWGGGASPHRFLGTTLLDWLRAVDPRSRALSVSRKDRGAILPLGRARGDVYWYAGDGRFTTSTYYADRLPAWVQAFNARNLVARAAGSAWTPLLPDSMYAEPDSVPAESGGTNVTFPHVLPADPAAAARAVGDFPLMDEMTIALALEGVEELGLGRGPQTDLLAVSLSATDAVGHRYGPDSREVHDQILRLDRALGVFIDSLYALRDSATIAFALTADHGVAPFPAVANARGTSTGARAVTLTPLVRATSAALAAAGVDSAAFDVDGAVVTVDRAAFQRAGVDADSVLRDFAARAREVPGVLRVDRWRELAARDTVGDDIARRWLHMFPANAAVELVITLNPYSVWGSTTWAHHGSPHDYDAHVPVIFYGPWFRAGRYDENARVVDIGPTLAHIAGVEPTEPLDGRVLRQALRRADARQENSR